MIAAEKIAEEIADAILAETKPGTLPSHALLVREFVNAYELFGLEPSERQHKQISDRVGELIRTR